MRIGRLRVGRARTLGALAVVAIVASACGANGDAPDEAASAAQPSTTDAAASDGSFGDLEELCGDGDVTVAADQQGVANGKLNLGVATDRASDVRPGLNKEVWDASIAYAEWCNEQGGIGGLEINVVELSGALFNVEAAMRTACTDVFAMVGGGFAQDNLEFSGNEGSDFHRCGLVGVPAFAASGEKSGSNGIVQPVPNTPDTELNTLFRDYKKLYPEEAEDAVIVYGQIPTMETVRDKYAAMLVDIGIEVAGTVSYPPAGVTDWVPYAEQVVATGSSTLVYVGEPASFASLLRRLREQGWDGIPVLNSNMYDEQLFAAGDDVPEGAIIRMPAHPFEEAGEWPATQQFLDLVDERVPDAKFSLLGVQSWSAWLLFTVAANACAEANDGVLERTCILEQAAAQDDWTGGGLHAPQDPARFDVASTSPCNSLVQARAGGFVRLYPDVGGEDDDGDGFHCPDNGVSEVDDGGIGVVDPDRPI